MNYEERKKKIIEYLQLFSSISNSEAQALTGAHRNTISSDFKIMVTGNDLVTTGSGKGARYSLIENICIPNSNIETIFSDKQKRELNNYLKNRERKKVFFNKTAKNAIDADFSYPEVFQALFRTMKNKIEEKKRLLSGNEKNRKMEKLVIDLSWASSNIEGNTYSLLETETLLKFNETTSGKSYLEAKMIINHKDAIELIREGADYKKITKKNLLELHQVLTSDLNIQTGFREHLVAITNSSFVPCDNQFQANEFFEQIKTKINKTKCIIEKSVMANLLLAYLQPFADGNKRTARMLGNAILQSNEYLPVSFIHVSKEEYIKSILGFYEKQDPTYFKQLFLKELNHSFSEYIG